MALMEALQGRMAGFAIPKYILDTPYGKVPLHRSYVLGRSGDHVVMRTYSGRLWSEPNPWDPEDDPAIRLPERESSD
jgi:lysine 2,3-aminomutase